MISEKELRFLSFSETIISDLSSPQSIERLGSFHKIPPSYSGAYILSTLYENKAVLSFHTNMKVPDEYRRFAIMGSKGMIEGDFVRGFLKAHDENNNLILDENYGSAFGQEIKGHYGADSMMVKDINSHLISDNFNLPVGVIECMEAGIVAMKLDESIKTNSIIDLTSTWNELDNLLK